MRDSLTCITNDNEFSFLWVEFQFHTIHPLLNTVKTLGELSKTGIKVPMVKFQIYLGVISIQMVSDIEAGNDITEGGSVKGKKDLIHLSTVQLTPNQSPRQLKRMLWSIVSNASERSSNVRATALQPYGLLMGYNSLMGCQCLIY